MAVHINARGIAEIARSAEMASAVEDLAEKIADNVRAQGHLVEGVPGDIALPVKVLVSSTEDMRLDRAKARVMLAHPSGLAVQAKHGALTRAAAEAGLEVKGE